MTVPRLLLSDKNIGLAPLRGLSLPPPLPTLVVLFFVSLSWLWWSINAGGEGNRPSEADISDCGRMGGLFILGRKQGSNSGSRMMDAGKAYIRGRTRTSLESRQPAQYFVSAF